jgi:Peroxisomal biogenesis factor 11 (PEX11)
LLSVTLDPPIVPPNIVMSNQVPGRRYLRFFKFIDAFALASKWFGSSIGITTVLDVGKWSCLGMYLFLESCTIIDAMEIWSTTWAPTLLLEANKFWFYSLLFSLASSFLQVCQGTTRIKSKSPAKSSNPLTHPLSKKILTDACDLLVPGSITGWARTSPAIVGLATVISTLLASEEIWVRVQRATDTGKAKANGREVQARKRGKV